MKLTENQYNELLNLSHNYFKSLDNNPVNALLLDLVSKEKSKYEQLKFSARLKNFILRNKNKLEIIKAKKYRGKTENIDYFVFINEPTHYNQVIGILKILKKNNKYFLVITNKIKIFRQLLSDEINADIIPYKISINNSEEIKKKTDEYLKFVSTKNNLTKNDLESFNKIIKDNLVSFLKHREYFKNLLLKISPKQVVIGNDLSFSGRILATLCKQNNIHSIVIQHGTIPMDIIHKYHLVEKLFVFGKKSEEILLNLGIAKDRIIITGAPYLDFKLYNNNEKNRNTLFKYFNLKKFDKVILVAFSGAGQRTSLLHHIKLIDSIRILATEFSKYMFLIKLHRKDDIKYYEDLKMSFKNIIIKPKIKSGITSDIFDWLKTCDVLITGNSAVATEAMLIKKPVITLDLMNEYNVMDFINERISLHSKTTNEAKENLIKIINDTKFLKEQINKQNEFINKYYYNPDGSTAQKCVNFLMNDVIGSNDLKTYGKKN